jgi:hypothetical protein
MSPQTQLDTRRQIDLFGAGQSTHHQVAVRVQIGGYRVHTIAELLPPVNEAPVPGPASQVSGGPVRLLLPGPRRRHDEVIGDLPSEALLALVWGW